ncbi:adenylyl cyclase-associated protein 1-like isoform X2 [Procambarus clarkii]|uniref:adenylyl cyclase-associated protein 1-like isoform X2 n=2 Tax=Procambarus clarkii TaxID=6728 RepID=UPI0037428028
MGSACTCTKDDSVEDSSPKAKTNGHVLENGGQHDAGVAHSGHLGDVAHNGHLGDVAGLADETNNIGNGVAVSNTDPLKPWRELQQASRNSLLVLTPPNTLAPPPARPAQPPHHHTASEEELVSIMAGELAALVARLETAVDRLEKAGVPGLAGGARSGNASSQTPDEECTVPFVLAYDDLLSGPFKTFFDCSMKIGGDVASIAKMVQSTFINQRAFLVTASKSQRPLDTELPQVLEPTGKKIQEVIAFRESKRQSPFFNHLSAISESIPGLSWVAVTPAPAPYVKEMGDSAVFYTNRVLKEYREKDKIHVEWVQNWNNVFKELQEYVKKHHTTGLSWNTRGGNAMANLKPAPANCGVPPPPPPGIPPPPPMVKLEPKVAAADDGRSALFDSINKGTAITSGLKKVDSNAPRRHPLHKGARTSQTVTDDMKTHKNPSLREGPKPFVKQSSPPNRASPHRDGPTGPPKFALEGKKWFIEYQSDKPDLIVKDGKMDQSIYIFRCQNVVVQIKGKVNSVILDSCKKSAVVFENLVSSAEVVNCQSCKVQVMGVMPTISIEKTDGCQVYLSKDSLKTEIVTAKSTEMNILIPKDDGDFVECPVPEQFKTVINGFSLTTTCSEKAG